LLILLVQRVFKFIFHRSNLVIFYLNLCRILLKSFTTLFDHNLQLFFSFRSFQKNKHLWAHPIDNFLKSNTTAEVIFNTHRCSFEINLKLFEYFFQLLIIQFLLFFIHLLLISNLFRI